MLLSQWKKQVLEELPCVFSSQRAKAGADEETLRERLYQQIGQLQLELDWLKKSWTGPLSTSARSWSRPSRA